MRTTIRRVNWLILACFAAVVIFNLLVLFAIEMEWLP